MHDEKKLEGRRHVKKVSMGAATFRQTVYKQDALSSELLNSSPVLRRRGGMEERKRENVGVRSSSELFLLGEDGSRKSRTLPRSTNAKMESVRSQAVLGELMLLKKKKTGFNLKKLKTPEGGARLKGNAHEKDKFVEQIYNMFQEESRNQDETML